MKHIKIIYDTTGSLLSLIKNNLHQEVSAVYQAFANTLYSVHHLCDLRMDTKKCVYHQRNLVFNSLVMTLPFFLYARGLSYIYTSRSSIKMILGHLSSNKLYVPEITSIVGFSQVCNALYRRIPEHSQSNLD